MQLLRHLHHLRLFLGQIGRSLIELLREIDNVLLLAQTQRLLGAVLDLHLGELVAEVGLGHGGEERAVVGSRSFDAHEGDAAIVAANTAVGSPQDRSSALRLLVEGYSGLVAQHRQAQRVTTTRKNDTHTHRV